MQVLLYQVSHAVALLHVAQWRIYTLRIPDDSAEVLPDCMQRSAGGFNLYTAGSHAVALLHVGMQWGVDNAVGNLGVTQLSSNTVCNYTVFIQSGCCSTK